MISEKKHFQIIDDIKIHNLKCPIAKSSNRDKASCNCIHIESVDSIKYLGVPIGYLMPSMGYSY